MVPSRSMGRALQLQMQLIGFMELAVWRPTLGPDPRKSQTSRRDHAENQSLPRRARSVVDDLAAVIAAGDPAEGEAKRLGVDLAGKPRVGAAARRSGARQDRGDEVAVE